MDLEVPKPDEHPLTEESCLRGGQLLPSQIHELPCPLLSVPYSPSWPAVTYPPPRSKLRGTKEKDGANVDGPSEINELIPEKELLAK